MRVRYLTLALSIVSLTSSCEPSSPPRVDAGPDTSCGLDCVAQANYGLIVNRCFEYTDTPQMKKSPPSLAVWIREPFALEGGVKSIPLEYRKSGQTVQTDYFTIRNGDLVLLRRIAGGTSVTYKTEADITGVKWLDQQTGSGQTYLTKTTAFLAKDNSSTATEYRTSTDVTSATEKKTPWATSENAIKIIFGETPDHGSDSRRIFAAGTGFTSISSPFSLSGSSASTAHLLQRIRDIGTPDAGSEPCSLGATE
jgi:hypothetical protein